MMFSSGKLYFRLLSAFFLAFAVFSVNAGAQSHKAVDNKAHTADDSAESVGADDGSRAESAAAHKKQGQSRVAKSDRTLREETIANIAKDNTEGEDLEVRRAAISALGSHAGTIVVLEPQTGKVLTIVNQDWAIRRGFKPCSTIKLVTGAGGLTEGIVSPDGEITTRRFPMALNDALAFSNNSYFQTVGRSLGNEKMISYARSLGYGEPTGINAPGETAGKLPWGNNNARIYSHGDDFEISPVQLAVAVSAISNGGHIIIPRIPRAEFAQSGFRGVMKRDVKIPSTSLRGLLPGMMGAVAYGTARRSGAASLSAAGKTGSCIGQGSWLGLFASVAPAVNPKLAVVVITRGQGERGKYASTIAGKIYSSLNGRVKDGGARENIAKLEIKPLPKIDAKTSKQLDVDEGDDSDEGDSPVSSSPKKGFIRKQEIEAATAEKTVAKVEKPEVKKNSAGTGFLFPAIVIKVKHSTETSDAAPLPRRARIVH
jgi:penicillin-binding protein 2